MRFEDDGHTGGEFGGVGDGVGGGAGLGGKGEGDGVGGGAGLGGKGEGDACGGGDGGDAVRDSQRRQPLSSAVRASVAPSRAACHCPPPSPVVSTTPGGGMRT
eukprot:1116462-Prymnesium_polylepis.1